jgi:hypothetical protein
VESKRGTNAQIAKLMSHNFVVDKRLERLRREEPLTDD